VQRYFGRNCLFHIVCFLCAMESAQTTESKSTVERQCGEIYHKDGYELPKVKMQHTWRGKNKRHYKGSRDDEDWPTHHSVEVLGPGSVGATTARDLIQQHLHELVTCLTGRQCRPPHCASSHNVCAPVPLRSACMQVMQVTNVKILLKLTVNGKM